MTNAVRIVLLILSFVFPVIWMTMPVLAGVTSKPVAINYSCQLRITSEEPYMTASAVSYFIDTHRVANTTDYRLDPGDGGIFENKSGHFAYSYSAAGTYNPQAYIKDVNAKDWYRCQYAPSIQVRQSDSRILGVSDASPTPTVSPAPTTTPSPAPVSVQPQTGGRSWVTVGLILAAVVGLGLMLVSRLRRR